jgi:putative acetyltransferase
MMAIRHGSRGIIRPLEAHDESATDAVIRAVRREFGVTGEGFDNDEPDATPLYSIYRAWRFAYYVVDLDGSVAGGAGIAPYGGPDSGTCELQRMYLAPAARGAGYGRALLNHCLDTAVRYGYRRCYLETAASLDVARSLYLDVGFQEISEPLDHAVHPSCDAFYVIELADRR